MNMMSARPGEELVFLPLGGANEIGMNLNAYGYGPPHARRWIIVDIGVTFRDPDAPGVEVILPDPAYLESVRDQVDAIVLTHAHEDHIGAIAWLWPRFEVPVYATPFTAALVREKLKEKGLLKRVPLHEVPLGGTITIGAFTCTYVTLTHSIPEPNGLAISTPLGLVLHTGDWKIDPDPLVGGPTDDAALRALGDRGVLAMVCDSTNVFQPGVAGSEADVRDALIEQVRAQTGKVVVAAFASNVARLESAMIAAEKAGRSVCLVGRSMRKVVSAARSVGLLSGRAELVSEDHAGYLPADRIMYIATGSQGEARAALARIAASDHPNVTLGEGDCVLFSSRVIPGNEEAITAMQNRLAERGVRLITDKDAHIHVSGHPCRDELASMYRWVRPQIAVPVHGERRHILEHAIYARSLQVPFALTPRNGDMFRLAPGPAELIEEVPAGRLLVEGPDLLARKGDEVMRERKWLGTDGMIVVSLVVDAKGRLKSGPDMRTRGLTVGIAKDGDANMEALLDAAEEAFDRLDPTARRNETQVEESISRAVRKTAERILGKRPMVEVVLMDV